MTARTSPAGATRAQKALDKFHEEGAIGKAYGVIDEKEHYDISMDIGRRRLFPAVEKAPEAIVVAPGISCISLSGCPIASKSRRVWLGVHASSARLPITNAGIAMSRPQSTPSPRASS